MIGYIILTLFAYFLALFLVAMPFGLFYGFMHETSGMTISLEQYMSDSLMLITVLGSLVAISLFWLVLLLKKENYLNFMQVKKTSLKNLFVALLIGFGIYSFLYGALSFVNIDQVFPEYIDFISMIIMQDSIILTILSFGIIVPIFEEIMYRGIIFNLLRENMPITAALIIQALIFAIMHMNMLQGIYTFVGGLIIGLAYHWTKSLWVPIIIHVSWNTSSLIVYNLITEATTTAFNFAVIIAAIILITFSLLYFRQKNIKKEEAAPASSW